MSHALANVIFFVIIYLVIWSPLRKKDAEKRTHAYADPMRVPTAADNLIAYLTFCLLTSIITMITARIMPLIPSPYGILVPLFCLMAVCGCFMGMRNLSPIRFQQKTRLSGDEKKLMPSQEIQHEQNRKNSD